MLALASLSLPVIVAAVGVFFASSLIHMVFRGHQSDYRKLANEDEVRDVILKKTSPPGQCMLPYGIGKDGRRNT